MSSATLRSKGEAPKPKPKTSTKPVIKVDSAFRAPAWPTIEPAQQDIILKLLCNFLEPIGHHRSNHVIPSKGNRSKKRKRPEEEKKTNQGPTPPRPEITKHITIGFNSTFRHLQATINHTKSTKPEVTLDEPSNHSGHQIPIQPNDGNRAEAETGKQDEVSKPPSSPNAHLSCIFLTHQAPLTHIPYTPLPLLSHLSSSHHPTSLPTRLVPLASNAEVQLCKALGIPRVGIISIFEDAPGAGALVDYVREKVEVTDVPWVREAGKGEWLGTKIMFGEEGKEG